MHGGCRQSQFTCPFCQGDLLSEVARTSSGVEIVLHDANFLRGRDAKNVTGDGASRTHRIIDDQHGQVVTSRAIYPNELAVFEQTLARLGRVKTDHRSPFRVAGSRRDVFSNQQPGPELLDHASKLGRGTAIVALPTATYPSSARMSNRRRHNVSSVRSVSSADRPVRSATSATAPAPSSEMISQARRSSRPRMPSNLVPPSAC